MACRASVGGLNNYIHRYLPHLGQELRVGSKQLIEVQCFSKPPDADRVAGPES
jgi:hypothetical protein